MSKLHACTVFCFFLSILLVQMSAYAVDVFKVSEYIGGHQIWFEAEAFDERDPDSENDKNKGFKRVEADNTNVKLPKDAFGDAIVNVRGTNTIWLKYIFDISEADGKGGTWYLWARMINPNNRSEWLWVLGDDDDKIPDARPVFTKGDDRVWEATVGPSWTWACRKSEGDVKELQDGENTMMVWFREGDATALRDVLMWSDTPTYTPTDDDYRNAKEIKLKLKSVEPEEKLTTIWGKIKLVTD